MATLAAASLVTILDSIAKGVQLFEAGVGIDVSVANTVAKGAANNVTTLVTALGAAQDVTALLLEFEARRALVVAGALYRTLQGERVQTAFDAHYGGTGGLNRFLATEGRRVHPDLRKIGIQLDAPNAFPPAIVTLGSFAVTGAGAGTFTLVGDVDQSLYGKANTVVRTTTVIGAVAIVATLTMKKADGTTVAKQVTIPNGSGSGVEVDIGVHGTDMYIGVTAISITGGTAGEGFEVRTEIERTLGL
jgi:hypothetical protein